MSFQQHQDDLKKSKSGQRNFGCPCGKTYLSYPALFTHVKQKHDGKAPGPLIKPKNQKTRGRPRLSDHNHDSQLQQSNFDPQEYLGKLFQSIAQNPIKHEHQFELTDGSVTCNDMMSHFLNSFQGCKQGKNVLICFICYIRSLIQDKFGQEYWKTDGPGQLIDMANQMVKSLPQRQEKFPIERNLLIELIYVLFKWMYKNKWTDHKLERKASQVCI